jgi:hypothetical protein
MSEHERLVSAALARAEHRRAERRRQPDDVLAVEVLRLRGQLQEQRAIHAKQLRALGVTR